MGVLGAQPGDFARCFGLPPDEEACERIIIGYYLFPKLQHLLEQLELIQVPVPPRPWPPNHSPDWLLHELVPLLLAPCFGGGTTQSALSAQLRLETTIKFRDAMKQFVKQLDEEIKELERRPKGKP